MEIYDLIANANWHTIIAMFAIGWYFTKDLKKEMREFRDESKAQGTRIDHLYQVCIDMLKERTK